MRIIQIVLQSKQAASARAMATMRRYNSETASRRITPDTFSWTLAGVMDTMMDNREALPMMRWTFYWHDLIGR